MPSQDETHAAEPGSSGSSRLSRRSLLQGAATAGAAGLAVTAMGTAQARAATDRPAPGDDMVKPLPSGPLVVHVRDAKSGDIEVFYGTNQVQLQDKELTARIARALG
jgi:hypothetical protein